MLASVAPSRPLALFGACFLAVLTAAPRAQAQDTDGDGAPDPVDAFPCDAPAAAVAFAPADGVQGILLFEDQWPAQGDLDFNDLVLAYHYRVLLDVNGRALSVRATFDPLAVGGVLENGLGLHLPVPAASVASVTRTIGGGSPQALLPSAGDAELTVLVSADLREAFGFTAGPINSLATLPRTTGARIVVDVVFAAPLGLGTGPAPYDVFVTRSRASGHEIHRTPYAGSSKMDARLFATADDGSTPGRWFVDFTGLPFVLALPAATAYPGEQLAISRLFPRIVSFAASGGATDADFYASQIDMTFAYRDVAGLGPLPSSVALEPAADRSCLASVAQGGLRLDLNLDDPTRFTGGVWADQSPDRRQAIASGAVPVTTVAGVTALHMRGWTGNGDLRVPGFYGAVGGGDATHTLEVWMYGTGSFAVDPFNTGGCGNPCLAYLESNSSFDASGGRGLTNGVVANEWHQYVIVQDGPIARTYRDGVLVATRSDWVTPTPAGRDVRIGSRPWADRTQSWYLSRMRYYDRVLGESEIRGNFIVHRAQYGL